MFTYTQTKVSDSTTTTSSVTVRIIWDVCSPNIAVSGTYESSYNYNIGGDWTMVALGNYSSNNCESQLEVYIDNVLLANTPYTFIGL